MEDVEEATSHLGGRVFDLEFGNYRPYSLRRGGNSYYFLCYKNIDLTMFKGRWDSIKTGKIGVRDFPYGIISSLPALPWVRPASRNLSPLPLPPAPLRFKIQDSRSKIQDPRSRSKI